MTMRRKPTVKFPMKVEFSTFCQVICQLFLLFSTIWVLDVKENRLLVANESKCRHAARAHAPRGYQISITGTQRREGRCKFRFINFDTGVFTCAVLSNSLSGTTSTFCLPRNYFCFFHAKKRVSMFSSRKKKKLVPLDANVWKLSNKLGNYFWVSRLHLPLKSWPFHDRHLIHK